MGRELNNEDCRPAVACRTPESEYVLLCRSTRRMYVAGVVVKRPCVFGVGREEKSWKRGRRLKPFSRYK